MFCKYCGSEINDNAFVCIKCGKIVAEENNIKVKQNHPYWTAGFVLSILSIIFFPYLIFGILGLIFGLKSKRTSSITMSIISLSLLATGIISIIIMMILIK